jgi:hypothetical protein
VTDRPYTDDDLRAEAARQHKTATEDPDFMGIGEQMDDEPWTNLGDHDFDTAQRAVDDLLGDAADVSRWAIDLGADGLQPSDEHVITLKREVDDKATVRVHFAFEPDMPEGVRADWARYVRDAVSGLLAVVQGGEQ